MMGYLFICFIKFGTFKGFVENDFLEVAEFFNAAVKLVLKIKANSKGRLVFSDSEYDFLYILHYNFCMLMHLIVSGIKFRDFIKILNNDKYQCEISIVRHEKENYANKFLTIGLY